MKQSFSFRSLVLLVGLLISSVLTSEAAAPVVSSIKHETPSQQTTVIQFDQSLSGSTVKADWSIFVNGFAVTGANFTAIATNLVAGRVTINFNLFGVAGLGHAAGETYLKPGEVLTIAFTNPGTLKDGATGTFNATNLAVPTSSVNGWQGDCSDISVFQNGTFGN